MASLQSVACAEFRPVLLVFKKVLFAFAFLLLQSEVSHVVFCISLLLVKAVLCMKQNDVTESNSYKLFGYC
jgi:hypothetical protein